MVMPLRSPGRALTPTLTVPEPPDATGSGTIAVDLDGTLAVYDRWHADRRIGEPVPAMAERVRQWLADGRKVVIFTSRVAEPGLASARMRDQIEAWSVKHFGQALPVTATKERWFTAFYDDRAVRVETNTGRLL